MKHLSVALALLALVAQTPPTKTLRVEVSFAAAARSEPVTGMVYVAISRENRTPPIQQTDPTGVPLFSKAVEQLTPGTIVAFGAADRGHPVASLRDIPRGDYWVQPF
ncbi:MAG TPA: hypothetical protein VH138_04950, partial [Vicinamibacterales bacterium]|nr:hypothetical protein [Vicinamibacterales bacterium]